MKKLNSNKFYLFIGTVVLMNVLGGCNGGTITTTERVPSAPTSSPAPQPGRGGDSASGGSIPGSGQTGLPTPQSDMGGSHTGGGNGIYGRPNEAYRQDITKLTEYTEFVFPRMNWLRTHLPNFAYVLEHITSAERQWFFTPTSLEPIETVIIGVPIYSGENDQLALQDKSEIWIAKSHYEKMSPSEKGVLLMHEMVMGARLMEFQRGYDKCLALSAKDLDKNKEEDQNRIKNNRRDCGFQYPKTFDFGRDIVNSKELTQSVRTLVGKLMAPDYSSLDPAELQNWLIVHNFIF